MQQLSRLSYRPSRSPRCLPDLPNKIEKFDLTSANTYKKYLVGFDEPTNSRQTRRKNYQPQTSRSEALIEKNKKLSDENAELYRLLEERGRIIIVLEKKLQSQAAKRGIEESAHRNRDSSKNQPKLAQYEQLIIKLKRQIQQLKSQRSDDKTRLIDQFHKFKNSTGREKLTYQRDLQTDLVQLSRQEDEAKHFKALLNIKTLELQELSLVYRTQIDSQKAQILSLQTQLADLAQRHKSEILEIRMSYEHRLQNCSRQRIHEMEVNALQHSLQIKELVNIAEAKKQELQKLKSAMKTDKAQVDRKYEQLISNNDKLQTKIQQVQEYYKQFIQDEVEKVKQLHRSELASLIANKDAILQNLEIALRKLEDVSAAKGLEIQALNSKVNEVTMHAHKEDQKSKTIIEGLKAEVARLELDQLYKSRREKIKFEELKDADITALKEFYEHQIQMLNAYLHEQMELNERQKNTLYQEIDEKAEMRRNFDMEIQTLSLRIKELEGSLGSLALQRKTELQQMSQRLLIATEIRQKQTEDKEKFDFNAEKQLKQLQRLITAKDNEIQELNNKIIIIKQNHASQINQKDNEIERLKKQCEQVESRIKKQKYVFENELKKKQTTIKTNKSIYDAQIQRLKNNHAVECQSITKEMSEAKSTSELELTQLKTNEKRLRRQLESILQSKQTEIQQACSELLQKNQRLATANKQQEQRRANDFNKQKKKLENEISELNKKLLYKQEDLRNINDKYHRLEQKLAMVLDSQEKLKSIENKMNVLGQENIYVKHLVNVIKPKIEP